MWRTALPGGTTAGMLLVPTSFGSAFPPTGTLTPPATGQSTTEQGIANRRLPAPENQPPQKLAAPVVEPSASVASEDSRPRRPG